MQKRVFLDAAQRLLSSFFRRGFPASILPLIIKGLLICLSTSL